MLGVRRILSFWLPTLRPSTRHLCPRSALCLRVTTDGDGFPGRSARTTRRPTSAAPPQDRSRRPRRARRLRPALRQTTARVGERKAEHDALRKGEAPDDDQFAGYEPADAIPAA